MNKLMKQLLLCLTLAGALMSTLVTSMSFAQQAAAGVNPNAQALTQLPTQAPAKKSSARVLTRTELDALLVKPEQLLLIDVRRPDELSAIGGFPVYLSIQAGDLEKYLAFIPRDRSIVTVSNHAARAGNAADLLASKGFKVIGAVGAQTYEQEGGTLNKIVPPAKTADASK